MDLVERLRRQLDGYANAGYASRLAVGGKVRISLPALHALVDTHWRENKHWVDVCSVAAVPLRCGEERGVMAALACGNYKDRRSFVAAGQACASTLAVFETTLLSRADIVPAIRRAVLEAHEAIVELSRSTTNDPQMKNFVRNDRRGGQLTGIGAEIVIAVAFPDTLYTTWVGDMNVLLARDGSVRRMNLPHNGLNEARGRMPPEEIQEHFRFCVTRVLGVAENPPNFDVTRLELRPGDRVLFGTCDLAEIVPALSAASKGFESPIDGLGSFVVHEIADLTGAAFPGTVGIIELGGS